MSNFLQFSRTFNNTKVRGIHCIDFFERFDLFSKFQISYKCADPATGFGNLAPFDFKQECYDGAFVGGAFPTADQCVTLASCDPQGLDSLQQLKFLRGAFKAPQYMRGAANADPLFL